MYGDEVERDEPLVLIATDKVEIEIPAPASRPARADRPRGRADCPVGTVIGAIS
jgi:pyruvate/2-oxoglutarate dehydrogenase complex dihydrolipoamide acyltransferase (E2) component